MSPLSPFCESNVLPITFSRVKSLKVELNVSDIYKLLLLSIQIPAGLKKLYGDISLLPLVIFPMSPATVNTR